MIFTRKLLWRGYYGIETRVFTLDIITEVISDYGRDVYHYRNLTLYEGQVMVVMIC